MEKELTCKMYLSSKFYHQLSEEGKELYELTPNGYCAEFPMIFEDGITLGNCVVSFCEVAYVHLNPKYDIDRAKEVSCELYKPGKGDETFNILVTIQYSKSEEFHELLFVQQRELSETVYAFEIVGDQTMFAL